jgi:surface carbohydrate biosynthesis protein (TIGR04326 family)
VTLSWRSASKRPKAPRPSTSAISVAPSHLTVLAAEQTAAAAVVRGSWLLRLAGTVAVDDSVPPGLRDHADAAAEEVRRIYPRWLWEWAVGSGVFSMTAFTGPISWWWYAPISEKSCLRSPLIRELYWLVLLRRLLDAHPGIREVSWHGDDARLAAVAEQLVVARGRRFVATVTGAGRRTVARLVVRRLAYVGYALIRWAVVRADRNEPAPAESAELLFFTRFPKAWDLREGTWRDRTFGDAPEYLAGAGHPVVYAAAFYGGLAGVLRGRRRRRSHAVAAGVCELEPRLGLWRFLRCQTTPALFARYLKLRRRGARTPVAFAGIDVTSLLWRELDESVLSPEIPACVTVEAAMRSLLETLPRARGVVASFEYQPSERAVAIAAHSRPGVTVTGVQAAMYNGNQMGWNFQTPETERAWLEGQRHHMPDVVCAYGELAERVFARGLGEERVEVIGGLRYPFAARGRGAHTPRRGAVLVATTSMPAESTGLIDLVLAAAAELPDTSLLFKFHPLVPLGDHVARAARRYPGLSWESTGAPMTELLPGTSVTVCGGTSAAVEAIVYGSMPLVFRPIGEITGDPTLHIREAVFTWSSVAELRAVLSACATRDESYARRVAAWPSAIAAHLHRIDGEANRRLLESLRRHGALAAGGPTADRFEVTR